MPIQQAIICVWVQADSELQKAGAVNKESRRGTTALTAAGLANQNGVISILLKHGATVVMLISSQLGADLGWFARIVQPTMI